MAAIRLAYTSLLPSLIRQASRSPILSQMSWSKLLVCSNLIRENRFCSSVPKPQQQKVTVIFIDRDGDRLETQAQVGSSLLTVAIENDVELEAASAYKATTGLVQHARVRVVFLLPDGRRQEVNAKVGDNLLDIITENDIDIDGFGACEGTLACSTCHLIFKQQDYDKIPDKPTDEEMDMLDLAYGLTDTSRLGCQVIVTKDMDGLEISVPKGVADARNPS